MLGKYLLGASSGSRHLSGLWNVAESKAGKISIFTQTKHVREKKK